MGEPADFLSLLAVSPAAARRLVDREKDELTSLIFGDVLPSSLPSGTFLNVMAGMYQQTSLKDIMSQGLYDYTDGVARLLVGFSAMATRPNLNSWNAFEQMAVSNTVKNRSQLGDNIYVIVNAFKIIYEKYLIYKDRSTILDSYILSSQGILTAPIGVINVNANGFELPCRFALPDMGVAAVAQNNANYARVFNRATADFSGKFDLTKTIVMAYRYVNVNVQLHRDLIIDTTGFATNRQRYMKFKVHYFPRHYVVLPAGAGLYQANGNPLEYGVSFIMQGTGPNAPPVNVTGPFPISTIIEVDVPVIAGNLLVRVEPLNLAAGPFTASGVIAVEGVELSGFDVKMGEINLGKLDMEYGGLFKYMSPSMLRLQMNLSQLCIDWVQTVSLPNRPMDFQGPQLPFNLARFRGGTMSNLRYFVDRYATGNFSAFYRTCLLLLIVCLSPRILSVKTF
jgi:hypothetical protein